MHALTRANYLASPPLVVAYALAGTVCMLLHISNICMKCFWSLLLPYCPIFMSLLRLVLRLFMPRTW